MHCSCSAASQEWCIELVKSKVLDIMRLAPQQHPEAITRLVSFRV